MNLEQNSDKPFVRHFKAKYTSSTHLPIWMAVELMSLGNVTTMYQGCDDRVRDLVATNVAGVSNAIFGSWLLTLLNVRNICAHHGRLWNRTLGQDSSATRLQGEAGVVPAPLHRIEDVRRAHDLQLPADDRHDEQLVTTNNSTWGKLLATLLPEHPRVVPAEMGFPVKGLNSPLWANAKRTAAAATVHNRWDQRGRTATNQDDRVVIAESRDG